MTKLTHDWICGKCRKSFKKRPNLERHIDAKHPKDSYVKVFGVVGVHTSNQYVEPEDDEPSIADQFIEAQMLAHMGEPVPDEFADMIDWDEIEDRRD